MPKIKFINYHNKFPWIKESGTAYTRWFSFDRYWMGKIWQITVKHYAISIDFRRNWIADMVDPDREVK